MDTLWFRGSFHDGASASPGAVFPGLGASPSPAGEFLNLGPRGGPIDVSEEVGGPDPVVGLLEAHPEVVPGDLGHVTEEDVSEGDGAHFVQDLFLEGQDGILAKQGLLLREELSRGPAPPQNSGIPEDVQGAPALSGVAIEGAALKFAVVVFGPLLTASNPRVVVLLGGGNSRDARNGHVEVAVDEPVLFPGLDPDRDGPDGPTEVVKDEKCVVQWEIPPNQLAQVFLVDPVAEGQGGFQFLDDQFQGLARTAGHKIQKEPNQEPGVAGAKFLGGRHHGRLEVLHQGHPGPGDRLRALHGVDLWVEGGGHT